MIVTDTVAYYGLTPGKQYMLKGELMDKATGAVLKDAAGNPVTAEKQFTPNATAGTVEIQFTFDGSNLKKDQNLVAFEHVLTLHALPAMSRLGMHPTTRMPGAKIARRCTAIA